jgi:hypothetical protein
MDDDGDDGVRTTATTGSGLASVVERRRGERQSTTGRRRGQVSSESTAGLRPDRVPPIRADWAP